MSEHIGPRALVDFTANCCAAAQQRAAGQEEHYDAVAELETWSDEDLLLGARCADLIHQLILAQGVRRMLKEMDGFVVAARQAERN